MIDIADDVLVHVPDCPTLLARDYVTKAMRKLEEDVGLDTETIKLYTVAGGRNYPVDVLGGRESVGVVAVRLDGSPVPWSILGGKVRLDSCDISTGQALEIDVALVPDGGTDTADYQNAVKDYALFRLLRIPQQRWTDPTAAAAYLASYSIAKSKVASEKSALKQAQSNEPMMIRAAFPWT